ncbi:hypothetical protein [Streptococcus suis]|uniref:Phage protein n=1 Tax=Streptococcus suis TaxID=1307 RepID=A0A9X4MXH9_STRSU|nr:hypothetical protein [Streptococcus suis]MDG4528001.1 hypothetical protein [Streptococcus suis]MDG4530416.1 hypothetical protein [Streptococcus suis]HEM6341949.1 hypothetical protein [Streptococcus suis]
MFKVKVRFNDGSSLDYTSNDKAEENKIRYSLDNNAPLAIVESNRTIMIVPQNIIFVDVTKVEKQQETDIKGMGFLIKCANCGELSTIRTRDTNQSVCYKCKGEKQ